MISGYHGQYWRVDLSRQVTEAIPIDPEVLRGFIGGVGLGAWLLDQECPHGVDPLAPEAPLVFCFSPLVGTPLTTSAKFAVVAKSPLTHRFNDSLASSHFAIAGKRAGADALVIVGTCERPSLLLFNDGKMGLEPANDLWGLSSREVGSILQTRLGNEFQTAVIGQAGERLVRYATISHANRHAGRGGLGAVMGSKQLKAIAVRGTKRTPVADAEGVIRVARDLSRRSFGPSTQQIREQGTVGELLTFNRLNALPTRNFQQGTFEAAEQLSGEALHAARRVTRHSCAACTIGCERIFASKKKPSGTRMEYESLFALGPLCGISDPDAILEASGLCDQYGLDTISTGATIAFAMECAERGLLDEPDLRFGNARMLMTLIEQIGQRTGLGEWLADGTRLAAERIGGEAPDFAPHVKGLEIPGYEPRTLQTMALGFAVGARGADHNRSGAYESDLKTGSVEHDPAEEVARRAIETEDRAAIMDSLILCKFLRETFEEPFREWAELLVCVTGWDITAEELRTTAGRIVTAKKRFNQREGWTPAEDTLPKRFLSEGLPAGTAPGATLPRERLTALVRAYNQARGWHPQGWVDAPTEVG